MQGIGGSRPAPRPQADAGQAKKADTRDQSAKLKSTDDAKSKDTRNKTGVATPQQTLLQKDTFQKSQPEASASGTQKKASTNPTNPLQKALKLPEQEKLMKMLDDAGLGKLGQDAQRFMEDPQKFVIDLVIELGMRNPLMSTAMQMSDISPDDIKGLPTKAGGGLAKALPSSEAEPSKEGPGVADLAQMAIDKMIQEKKQKDEAAKAQ